MDLNHLLSESLITLSRTNHMCYVQLEMNRELLVVLCLSFESNDKIPNQNVIET